MSAVTAVLAQGTPNTSGQNAPSTQDKYAMKNERPTDPNLPSKQTGGR
jgi:hypothetical protein